MRFSAPPNAILLYVTFLTIGLPLGAVVGFDAAVVVKIIEYDGMWRVPQASIGTLGFLNVPAWFGQDQRSSTNLVGAVLSFVFAMGGIAGASALWRYLVVTKLRWMSDQEASEYLKRADED